MFPLIEALADPTRRLILALVTREGELCVCELVAALDDIQPKISRHLAVLREAGWVLARREGTWMHYRLAALPAWAVKMVEALVEGGVAEREQKAALRRLAAFPNRPARVPLESVS